MAELAESENGLKTFTPGPKTSRALRDVLGCFATGVTLVTCRDEEGPLAIAVNSFSSVSLDPALILWCPAKAAQRHDPFVKAKHFSVHVLCDDQMDLCRQAAMGGRNFEIGLWQEDAQGVPILASALARFDCTTFTTYPGGDHTIILGKVNKVTCRDGSPLLFVKGTYGGFTASE